jgi:crotonobetainyl-CoA:carnitine CoA-transferase CaiB-like acyl-CoA transferase
VQTIEQPGLGWVTMLGRVFRVDGADGAGIVPAPALGADTDAVLAELDG